jgi:hypothetical protein
MLLRSLWLGLNGDKISNSSYVLVQISKIQDTPSEYGDILRRCFHVVLLCIDIDRQHSGVTVGVQKLDGRWQKRLEAIACRHSDYLWKNSIVNMVPFSELL